MYTQQRRQRQRYEEREKERGIENFQAHSVQFSFQCNYLKEKIQKERKREQDRKFQSQRTQIICKISENGMKIKVGKVEKKRILFCYFFISSFKLHRFHG